MVHMSMYMLILIMFHVNLLSTCLCNAHAGHVSRLVAEYMSMYVFILTMFQVLLPSTCRTCLFCVSLLSKRVLAHRATFNYRVPV